MTANENREVAVMCVTMEKRSTDKGIIMYIMTEAEAQKLCSDPRTCSSNPQWMYAYTGYWKEAFGVDGWRELPEDMFRKDDGRFDELMAELHIKPIYRRGSGNIPSEPQQMEEKSLLKSKIDLPAGRQVQLSLFDLEAE